MTDVQPTPSEDTSVEPSAPDQGHAPEPDQAQSINYEQRYNDLRPQFDRTSQRAAELEQLVGYLHDPELRDQALAALGVTDDEPEYEEAVSDAVEQRLAALEQEIAERDERARQDAEVEAEADFIADEIEKLAEQVGELDNDEVEFLVARGINSRDHNGKPDIQAAWQRLSGVYDKRQQSWLKTKKTPQIPGGQSAKQAFDTSTRQGRNELSAHLAAQLETGE